MSYLDTAIVIAWPECTARGDESILILLRKAGIVKNLNMRVGHAAICLINPQTAEVLYYDFGRYITPRGYGRARSKYTDPTLVLETRATFDEDKNLTNVEDIAQELDAKSKYRSSSTSELYLPSSPRNSLGCAPLVATKRKRNKPTPG